MKKGYRILAYLLVLSLLCVGGLMAADTATKEECTAKCKEVAKMIQDSGVETAVKAVMAPDSPFVWKDSYVYVLDLNGIVLAHPANPKLVGQTAMGFKDAEGKLLVAEMITLAKDKGEGWVDYMWMVPGTKDIKPKETYVYRIPNQDIVVMAGIYKY